MGMLHRVLVVLRRNNELKCEWDMHSADYLLMCLGDFNVYIGMHIDGFDEFQVGMAKFRGIWKNVIRVLSEERIMCVKYMV